MNIAIPVTSEGRVEQRWGKAPRIAVAAVADGAITGWDEYAVGWDLAHDEGTEGSHHARIVRFLREHEVTHVVVDHMGAPMQHTLGRMGVVILGAGSPDARESVILAVASLR